MYQLCWPSFNLKCGDISLEVSYLEASWVSLCPPTSYCGPFFSSSHITAMGTGKGYGYSVWQALVKTFSAIIAGIHTGNTQNIAGTGPQNVDSTTVYLWHSHPRE